MTEKHQVEVQNAAKILDWLQTRGGLQLWDSADLSNPGQSWTTPLKDSDGNPTKKPHWVATPGRVITDPVDCEIIVPKELRRFRIGIRRGTQGLMWKVTDGGTRRIRAAVAKALEKYGTAWYEFDYDTQEAVIMIADETVPLTEENIERLTGATA